MDNSANINALSPGTPALEREDIGHLIKLISDGMRAAADADLRSRGLTFPQTTVLFYLFEHGGRALQKDIERYLRVSHPTAAGLIGRLKRAGFVTSGSAPLDRRQKQVLLTPKAEKLQTELKDFIEQRERLLLSGLDDDEIGELCRMLLKLLNNL